jgi:hypothetical protein
MKALGTSKEQEESKEGDQEQGSLKTSPRPQTDSDFSDPLILGNLTRYAFQWNRFQLNWTLGVDRNSRYKLAYRAVPGCRITYLGHWAMYRVGVH